MVITGMPWLSISAQGLIPEAEADVELDFGGRHLILYIVFFMQELS